jgi:hypothetical protein
MAYEDMNGDKYTDIVTVNDAKTEFTINLFEPTKKMFMFQKTIKPTGCFKIVNVVVGRSTDRIRIFVTCTNPTSTNIKIYDKAPVSLDIVELPNFALSIEQGSLPFISDLNGDFLEDVLFSDVLAPHKIKVAFQTLNPSEFIIKDFESTMLVTDETEGCL